MPNPRSRNDIWKAGEMWANEEISLQWKAEIFDFSYGLGENRLCSRVRVEALQESCAA